MKKLATYCLTLSFFAILTSCSKGKEQDTIPGPPEGTYEIIAYNANNQKIFTRKGDAMYVNVTNYGTQIRLDDPDFVTRAAINPDDVFASIVLQGKQKINSPIVLSANDFNANIYQRWYSLGNDWSYRLQEGSLKIKEVAPGKIQGEFIINLIKTEFANSKWGDTITIKGKFYANCGNYGC
jgi:hypothetical protein